MNNHLNMLRKQAKFDCKCSKMRWRLGIRPRPRWGTYDVPPKSPNRERKPLPSQIPGYATQWRSQELMMGGVCPSRLGVFGSVVSSKVGAGTHFRAFEVKFGLFRQHI